MAVIGNLTPRSAKATSGGTWIQSALAVSASTGLTVPAGATHAIIDNSGSAAVRYRIDGGTPTASVGARILAGGSLQWTNPDVDYGGFLANFKAIQEAATGTLEVTYFTHGTTP